IRPAVEFKRTETQPKPQLLMAIDVAQALQLLKLGLRPVLLPLAPQIMIIFGRIDIKVIAAGGKKARIISTILPGPAAAKKTFNNSQRRSAESGTTGHGERIPMAGYTPIECF